MRCMVLESLTVVDRSGEYFKLVDTWRNDAEPHETAQLLDRHGQVWHCNTRFYLFTEPEKEDKDQDPSILDKDMLLATLMELGISFEQSCQLPNLIDMGFSSRQIVNAVIKAETTNLHVLLDHMNQGIQNIKYNNNMN